MYKRIFFQNFYIFIFGFWYSTEIVFNTTLNSILGVQIDILNNLVNWLIFMLLMLQIIFMQSYTKKELIVVILITLPIVISTGSSGNKSLLSLWMFIVGSKKISFDKIVQTAYRILIIMIPLVIFLRLMGLIDDYTIMRGSVQRFSLGFSHPNQLGMRIFQLTLCHCYMNRMKLSIIHYWNIIFAVAFTFIISNSKTAYISLIVFLSVLLFYEYIERKSPIITKIFARSLVIGAFLLNVFSLTLSYIDVNRNVILSRIDKWMSFRFSWCHRVWQIYGVSFWGQKVYIWGEELKAVGRQSRLYLDNAYVAILLRYGILVFLIISFMYLYLIKSMVIRKEYVLTIILFLYSLYGLMETGLFMLSHNIFLLSFSDLLYHKMRLDIVQNGNAQQIEWAKKNE